MICWGLVFFEIHYSEVTHKLWNSPLHKNIFNLRLWYYYYDFFIVEQLLKLSFSFSSEKSILQQRNIRIWVWKLKALLQKIRCHKITNCEPNHYFLSSYEYFNEIINVKKVRKMVMVHPFITTEKCLYRNILLLFKLSVYP